MRKVNFLIFLLFAFISAWQDIRHRGIPVYLLLIFASAAMFNGFATGMFPACLSGSLVGLALLLISYLTHGAIGGGDGWFFAVSGLLLSLSENFCIFTASVFLGGIFSLFIFVIQRLKNGRYAGKDTLPFIPFAAAAGVLVFMTGI